MKVEIGWAQYPEIHQPSSTHTHIQHQCLCNRFKSLFFSIQLISFLCFICAFDDLDTSGSMCIFCISMKKKTEWIEMVSGKVPISTIAFEKNRFSLIFQTNFPLTIFRFQFSRNILFVGFFVFCVLFYSNTYKIVWLTLNRIIWIRHAHLSETIDIHYIDFN